MSTLMTSIVEHRESSTPGASVIRYDPMGERHASALVEAVLAAYPRPADIEATVASLVGKQVTLLLSASTMMGASLIMAESAKLFQGQSGVAYLPKGKRTRGYRLQMDRLLDVVEGYNQEPLLSRRLADVRALFPELQELTRERVEQLPRRGDDCTLGVFGRLRLPHMASYDSVWLLHSYDPEGEIAEGVIYLRPEDGTSEHGSIYLRDLLAVGGEIVNPARARDPIRIPLAKAIEMTEWDHDAVLAAVRQGGRG